MPSTAYRASASTSTSSSGPVQRISFASKRPWKPLGDLSEVDPEIWAKSRALFRIGEPPLQIDILLAISGVEYNTATADAVDGMYGHVPVRFLGRTALITNKKASGRPKDLADVDLLTSDDPER